MKKQKKKPKVKVKKKTPSKYKQELANAENNKKHKLF